MGRIGGRFLTGDRRDRFESIPTDIIPCDLRRGIPWPDASVDAVYSSHVLEHIDRPQAHDFAREMWRVLKPGGIVRVVVPDLELLTLDYLDSLGRHRAGNQPVGEHERAIVDIIEQMVRKRAVGSHLRGTVGGRVERLILGDARRRGETHQWMYDEVTLSGLLVDVGFASPRRVDHTTSAIPSWSDIALDTDAAGAEYKPRSLYIEAEKPR